MPSVRSNGINLYYEIHGEGKPLVLIAGIGYSLWMWHRMIPWLERKVQVIAFDNRGVAGCSGYPQGNRIGPFHGWFYRSGHGARTS